MLAALIRGLAVGFIGAMPVGPVNAAVIDTAFRRGYRRALALGMGGAFVDLLYSQIATAVVKPVLERFSWLETLLMVVGGIVLVIFGVIAIKAPPIPLDNELDDGRISARDYWSAFRTGVFLTISNPACVVTWVFVAGAWLSGFGPLESVLAGVGIFAGTTLWFVIIAYLAARGRVKLGARAQWITRTVGVLLVAYGMFLVAKVGWAAHHNL